ncbi:hypothetical protein J6590_035402 [Homalodisca vitripennis]|nr:hypothetical protein J6590_035402 [Homalodisca vitripennis]
MNTLQSHTSTTCRVVSDYLYHPDSQSSVQEICVTEHFHGSAILRSAWPIYIGPVALAVGASLQCWKHELVTHAVTCIFGFYQCDGPVLHFKPLHGVKYTSRRTLLMPNSVLAGWGEDRRRPDFFRHNRVAKRALICEQCLGGGGATPVDDSGQTCNYCRVCSGINWFSWREGHHKGPYSFITPQLPPAPCPRLPIHPRLIVCPALLLSALCSPLSHSTALIIAFTTLLPSLLSLHLPSSLFRLKSGGGQVLKDVSFDTVRRFSSSGIWFSYNGDSRCLRKTSTCKQTERFTNDKSHFICRLSLYFTKATVQTTRLQQRL